MDAHLILQILSLCVGIFAAFVSLRVKVAVGELRREFEAKIGDIKADIGYLKGRIDSLDRGERN